MRIIKIQKKNDFARERQDTTEHVSMLNDRSSYLPCIRYHHRTISNSIMALQALQGLCPSMHLACRLARPCFPPKSTLRSSFRSLKTGVKPKLCIAKASSDFGADLEKDINESTLAVDTMVQEISKTLFIDTATAYVVGRLVGSFTS